MSKLLLVKKIFLKNESLKKNQKYTTIVKMVIVLDKNYHKINYLNDLN